MAGVPLYTSMNIPSATSHPSVNCLQWTGDGQMIFVARSAVYILTPDTGINFDSSSTVKSPLISEDGSITPLNWFRTMIQYERAIVTHWPSDSQEWGAVALGSLDISLRSVAASPSNLTDDGGCLLAVLNSNLELSLWGAVKNRLKGQWIKIQDVTLYLKALVSNDMQPDVQQVLQAQVVCAAWSCQADFSTVPASTCDGSLLALGNRAGSILFLRLMETPEDHNYFHHESTIHVGERWVTHLAWSPWTTSGLQECRSQLACALSDGSLILIDVVQNLVPKGPPTAFGDTYSIKVSSHISGDAPDDVDDRSITALSWIHPADREPVLVFCKPGTVYLWYRRIESGGWTGTRKIRLRSLEVAHCSSPFYPVSGLQHSAAHDTLLLSLFNGTFRVISELSTEPTLNDAGDVRAATASSSSVSAAARGIFEQIGGKQFNQAEVNHISGLTAYDGLSTAAWVHEGSCPTDFSYKHDSKHNSTFVVAALWHEDQSDPVVRGMEQMLATARAAKGDAPIHLLRPSFFHLRKPGALDSLHHRILAVLNNLPADEQPYSVISVYSGELDDALRSGLRGSLVQHLFGFDSLLSLRLRLGIADYCWKYAPTPQAQDAYGAVAQGLLSAISHRILRALVRHLTSIASVLNANDAPFVFRIVVQSLLPGSPEELSAEAQTLSIMVTAALSDANGSAPAVNLDEHCPACGVVIPLQDITNAVCENGHIWLRCSVTSFILTTPMVRTCLGCTRKAFLPPKRLISDSVADSDDPNWLPSAARGWFVEELLHAVRRCLFCGNSFVSLV